METVKLKQPKAKSSSTSASQQAAGPVESRTERLVQSLENVLEYTLKNHGADQVNQFLEGLVERLQADGLKVAPQVNTPYVNTIPAEKEPAYPGNRQIERR